MPTLETHPYLVLTDVDAIQTYIFSSVKLATIAGASMVIVQHDRTISMEAGKLGGWILSSNGGAATILFPEGQAESFAELAEESFRAASGSGHLTVSDVIDVRKYQREGNSGFAAALEAAARSLEQRKRLGFDHGEQMTYPLARRCDVGSREPATAKEPMADGDKWIGETARKKWNARKDAKKSPGQLWVSSLDGFDEITSDEIHKRLPQDFNELAGNTDYLALVVADVNGVGDRIAELASPEHYQRFAHGLANALGRSLAQALNATMKPRDVWGAKDDNKTLPAVVLFHGGDDLVIACNGELALPLMEELTKSFDQVNKHPELVSTGDGEPWNDGKPVGMSAVGVITGRKFPFRTSHRIAKKLLSEAKRTARSESDGDRDSDWHAGAVDFALVTESHADAESLTADREYKDDYRTLHLTGKPFCAVGPGPRTLAGFKRACQKLYHQFPNSRLYELREICSPTTFRDLHEDDVSKARALINEKLNNWQAGTLRNPATRTAWLDACVELGLLSRESRDRDEPPELLSDEGRDWRTVVGDLADAIGMWPNENKSKDGQS